MQNKSIVFSTILTLIIGCLVFVMEFDTKKFKEPNSVYQVYLDGQALGLIEDESKLYELINDDQSDIIDKYGEYGIDYVYPPNNFDIVKYMTYNNNIINVNEIYNQIKKETNFTIKGYAVSFKNVEDPTKDFEIYILDQEVLREAVVELISAFVDRDQFEAYLNGTQLEIVETGERIESMGFAESITIKETFVSVDQQIFTNASVLSRFLLFGTNETKETYTVKAGDTVENIAFNNKLNEREFLIANPDIPTETAPLTIGNAVSVDLVSPAVSLKYQMLVVEDVETVFDEEVKYDFSKPSSYKEITSRGRNGIQRATKKVQVINGVESQGVDDVTYAVVREPVKQVVTRGRQASGGGGVYIDNGLSWAWPTNSPYIITSGYKWRGGDFHHAIDIAGTGHGSNIYAARGGLIVHAGYGGPLGRSAGINVVIDHLNGYYTGYAHLSHTVVATGQMVERRQVIGGMGRTGVVTGTHLHFEVTQGGVPYNGGVWFDPMKLWE